MKAEQIKQVMEGLKTDWKKITESLNAIEIILNTLPKEDKNIALVLLKGKYNGL